MKNLSKNMKTLIYSGAGLVALAAVLLILLLTRASQEPAEEIPGEDTSYLTFTDLTSADVVSISVKNETDDYVIEQIGEETFDISELLGAPRNETALNNPARYMSGFKARQIVEENVSDFAKYGLEEPRAEVMALFKNGETLRLYIGDKTPTTEEMTYIRKKDDSTVYAAWSYYTNFSKQDRRYYVALDLTADYETAGAPDVSKLTIERAGEETYIVEAMPKRAEDEVITTLNLHRIVEPVQIELSYSESQSFVFGLYGLSATEVEYVGREMPADDITGFNSPAAFIEMTAADETYSLKIGKAVYETIADADGVAKEVLKGYLGIYSEYPDVIFVFSPDALPWLNFSLEKIMAKTFLLPYIYNVSDFTVETPARTLAFEFRGDTETEEYFMSGAKVDTDKFKKLYQYCISASAEALFKGDAESVKEMPLMARFTYKYRDLNKPDDVVALYDSGDRRCIITVNGEPMFTCRAMYITRLEQNIEAYLNGETLIMSW